MSLFIISYDYRNGGNYNELYAAFEELGAIKVLESTWAIELKENVSTRKVVEHFSHYFDNEDGFMVSKIAKDSKTGTYLCRFINTDDVPPNCID